MAGGMSHNSSRLRRNAFLKVGTPFSGQGTPKEVLQENCVLSKEIKITWGYPS